jgi:class 3 adenylate cyclase
VAASNEPLPMTNVYESKALVLQVDLANYTGLTARTPVHELATSVQMLYLEFDSLVQKLTPFGVFKMDTMGDAYVVAAWLGEDADEEDTIVARKIVELGHCFVDTVASAQPVAFQCRVGVAAGQVCAGMLGTLQPRFQLVGEAMRKAAHFEALAAINTVGVSPEVRALIGDKTHAPKHDDGLDAAASVSENAHRAAKQADSGGRSAELTKFSRRGPKISHLPRPRQVSPSQRSFYERERVSESECMLDQYYSSSI